MWAMPKSIRLNEYSIFCCVLTMLQLDLSLLFIWYFVPILILAGKAGLEAYKTKKKKDELKALEEEATPFTRKL